MPPGLSALADAPRLYGRANGSLGTDTLPAQWGNWLSRDLAEPLPALGAALVGSSAWEDRLAGLMPDNGPELRAGGAARDESTWRRG